MWDERDMAIWKMSGSYLLIFALRPLVFLEKVDPHINYRFKRVFVKKENIQIKN